MAQTTNDNVIDMLDTHIAEHEASNPLAARLVQHACGDVSKEAWTDLIADSAAIPSFAFNLASAQKRHKFAASQLVKLFELTYALQVKLSLGKAVRDDDKLWIKNPENGELQEVTLKLVKDRQWEAHKLNKNDLNAIRSFYEDQLTKELPKIMHKVYSEFITLKSKRAYNANEVKLVLMNPDFMVTALADVKQYLNASGVFDNREAIQRDFLYESWFKYTKATGKNTEKIAEYFKKLIHSVVSRLAKELSVYRKSPSADKISQDDMQTICEMYAKYTQVEVTTDLATYFSAISCDNLFSKMKRQYEALGLDAGHALAARVNVTLDLAALAQLQFVGCNYYLVHLETLEDLSVVNGSTTVERVKSALKIVDRAAFDRACDMLASGKVKVGRDEVELETYVGSERLNTAIFKAIGAHNATLQTAEKTSRRKFSPELEAAIVGSAHFREKLLVINNGKSMSNSTRSKKQRTEKALILSYEAYASLEDDQLRAAFDDAHAEEGSADYGLVQKGTMFLSSASKIHDEGNAATISSFENSGLQSSQDASVIAAVAELINHVSLVVSAYSASLTAKPSKEQEGGLDLSNLAKKRPAMKAIAAVAASKSPAKTTGRSIAAPSVAAKKPLSTSAGRTVALPVKKPEAAPSAGANKLASLLKKPAATAAPSSPSKSPAKTASSSPSKGSSSPSKGSSTPPKKGGALLANLLKRGKSGAAPSTEETYEEEA